MSKNSKREISEDDFSEIAKTASDSGCLKSRKERFDETFGVFLNGHLVMSSEVQKSGDRKYFSFLDA
jgi:hypothetical protein